MSSEKFFWQKLYCVKVSYNFTTEVLAEATHLSSAKEFHRSIDERGKLYNLLKKYNGTLDEIGNFNESRFLMAGFALSLATHPYKTYQTLIIFKDLKKED